VSSTKLPRSAAGRLRSGDIAPSSGIYRLDHVNCSARDIWVRKGARLPLCPNCGVSSAFLLEREVEHISEDSDFR
jgi:hypothetical protein